MSSFVLVHVIVSLVSTFSPQDAGGEAAPRPDGVVPEVWGLERLSREPAASARFYSALGFATVRAPGGERGAVMKSGDLHLVITRTRRPVSPGEGSLRLNLHVADFAAAASAARAAGGVLESEEPTPFVLGKSMAVRDPDGHRVNLVQVEGRVRPAGSPPRVFNVSCDVSDLAAAEGFLTKLGLEVFSRRWLPRTLPWKRHGVVALVTHRSEKEVVAGTGSSLLLVVPDLRAASESLAARGIEVAAGRPRRLAVGRCARLAVPGAPRMQLLERSMGQRAFERLQQTAGAWRCSSTKGWTSRVTMDSIARGTVLVENDEGSHPGERMLTLFHMDGGRLMLTHYCVAGNQPRLVATAFEEGEIRFEFLDGTDLPTRDVGHMDSCVVHFDGPDVLTVRWTWYGNGAADADGDDHVHARDHRGAGRR